MKKTDSTIDWLSAGLVLLVHLLVLLLLWLVYLKVPERQEESGLPVVLGNMGNLDTDYEFTEVTPYSAAPVQPSVSPVNADPLVTQNIEETVAIDDGEKVTARKAEVSEPTPEQLRAQAEQRAAAEANQLMQNLFSGNQPASSASDASSATAGVAGSPQGNSTQGKTTGVGGFGTFDLNGRDVDGNGLQRPAYTVQEEGRVVVTITVNPAGEVIATSINKRSNTTNAQLRDAAEKAARRTRFNAVNTPDNQTGTITYYFRFK